MTCLSECTHTLTTLPRINQSLTSHPHSTLLLTYSSHSHITNLTHHPHITRPHAIMSLAHACTSCFISRLEISCDRYCTVVQLYRICIHTNISMLFINPIHLIKFLNFFVHQNVLNLLSVENLLPECVSSLVQVFGGVGFGEFEVVIFRTLHIYRKICRSSLRSLPCWTFGEIISY